jgi:uncharacterized protein (TIGR04141 family)
MISEMEEKLMDTPIIRLPRLEIIKDEYICRSLDDCLKEKIKNLQSDVKIEEFTVYGIEFVFNFMNYKYEIYYWDREQKTKENKKIIEKEIEIKDIQRFIDELNDDFDINQLKIRFLLEGKGKFTKPIKELIDCHIDDDNGSYFLKNGEWYYFNELFREYLKLSINNIEHRIGENLDENEYQRWKEIKEDRIARNETVENKLIYREYYFNKKQHEENGYELLDREMNEIKSILEERKNYKIEMADLFKDNVLWAVKIGNNIQSMIYNIEQSKDICELLARKEVDTDKTIEYFGLWFVLKNNITNISDVNSLQLLLAIESWKRKIEMHNYKPIIKISEMINI